MQGLNVISIHALLAESDLGRQSRRQDRSPISIHALLAESDTSPAAAPFRLSTFLSTLSLRRATAQAWPVLPAGCHFYPRSPCGERPLCPKTQPSKPTFLSTLSLRRATTKHTNLTNKISISIHALLAESDIVQWEGMKSLSISIHALLAESDRIPRQPPCQNRDFYPRSPCGERHRYNILLDQQVRISIHALLAESDPNAKQGSQSGHCISIHALLAESDPRLMFFWLCGRLFLSTLSLRRATSNESSEHTNNGNFYPRSPCGERPWSVNNPPSSYTISIHALLAESDFYTAPHT